jgi:predicted nucleic acid-binding Zn ribbon protein
METASKPCLACGKPVKGRTDKKFCDDYCRNQYNNQLKQEAASPLVKKINAILKNNHRLLQGMVPAGDDLGKCPRQKLVDGGFNFQYITHQYTNKKGNVYCFVYDYGYLPIEGDWVLVVKRAEK